MEQVSFFFLIDVIVVLFKELFPRLLESLFPLLVVWESTEALEWFLTEELPCVVFCGCAVVAEFDTKPEEDPIDGELPVLEAREGLDMV